MCKLRVSSFTMISSLVCCSLLWPVFDLNPLDMIVTYKCDVCACSYVYGFW